MKKIHDISNAVIVIDGEGSIYRINSAASEMFGFSDKEMLGMPIVNILPPSNINGEAGRNLVFDLLNGPVDSIYKKGVRKDGTSFPVDVFIVPFVMNGRQYYDCVIKDDSYRFFHERMEMLANVILRRVLIGEQLEQFASFIVDQLYLLFDFPLLWVGQYNRKEEEVKVLFSLGEQSSLSPAQTVYTSSDDAIHPAVRACQKMEMAFDEVSDENKQKYRLMAFPFLSKKDVMGVLSVLVPIQRIDHIIINRLENIALRLGMILQIAEDQNFLRLLGTAISSAQNAIFITDAEWRFIWANEAFTKLSGYSLEEISGKTPRILRSGLHPSAFYDKVLESLESAKTWRGEVVNRRKDGSLFTIDEVITPILNREGKIIHFVAVSDDLTERKNAEGKILHLSNYDQLTGLPNRSLFYEKIGESIKKAEEKKEITAVLLFDLCDFNRVNDTLGHACGDEILKIMADRVAANVSPRDLVARVEGDEYGVILHGLKAPDIAGHVANQIIHEISRPIVINDQEIVLGCCAGIAICPMDANKPEKLISYADMALFKSKEMGANTYFFFSQDMNREIETHLQLEQDIRQALATRQFFLTYQPQIDLTTGKVSGWEALVRWNHPTKGIIPPNVFISVAEDTGLITPLCEFVLDEAMGQLKKWNNAGFTGFTMAVNLSAAQFKDKNLLETLKHLVKKNKIKAHTLELEITETLLMTDAQKAYELLKEFSRLGMQIAIDDFGTGYSSLSYLSKFPVDKLKIDKSFVHDVVHEKESSEIVKAILSLGHALNLSVISEGVEHENQLKLLKKMGCNYIQGFYFSKPLLADEATAFLKERNSK